MSEPTAGAPEPQPRKREPLWARLKLGSWRRSIAHLGVLLAVAVAASYAISPGLYSQQIPQLRPDDIGKPFRSPSPSGFKASRDYDIVNDLMTEQRRQEARAAVRPVYDYNPGALGDLQKSVHQAFTQMRDALAVIPPVLDPKTHRPLDPALELPAIKQARQTFERALFPLEDDDFKALLKARFSVEVEQATLTLIEKAYPGPVAASRDELSRAHTGITLRDLAQGTERQTEVDTPEVFDLRESQNELERFASLPGNLLPDSPPMLRRAVLRLARRQVRPNLTINTAETESRRDAAAKAVKDAVIDIKKGQKIIGDGELITDTHLRILHGMRSETDQLDVFQLQMGSMGLVALLIAGCYAFFRAAFRRFRPTRKDAVLLGLLLAVMLGSMHLFVSIADAVHDRYGAIPPEALYYCIPVAAGAMLVRFLLSEELALFFAVIVASLSGILLGNSLSFSIFALVGSLVASERIARAKDRVGIFRAGLLTATVNFVLVVFLSLADGKGLTGDTFWMAAFAFLGTSLAVPVVVMGFTPLIEASFGYASDLKLIELANLNHPALKELIVQAPGTYHHSIIIGSLVEAAAETIGANPLLARSCAYYHDIGKGRNPLFFGENQKGDNRHDTLAPAMSAVIIKRHVTEGIEMARQYKLPKLVADAIPQHHGTRLVGYFFHKAMREQEGKENPQPVDETLYRYPGPKPQFREAALVMIADAVEASSRALPDPTTEKLQGLVQKMINLIFSEGQLDECDLTLRDLNLIAQSFLRTLEGIYHTRPQYPPGALNGGRPIDPRQATLALAPRDKEKVAGAEVKKTGSTT
jgi:putative nucleotidyltransferase with HDIG domain